MVDVPSAEQATKKWVRSIANVPSNYSDGVDGAKDVIAKGVAAEDLYQQKLQESMADRRRAKNLAKVTDSEWKASAKDKGASRIGPGMRAAEGDFRGGIAGVLNELAGIDLPARTADPEQNVINRVLPIAKRLSDWKKRG